MLVSFVFLLHALVEVWHWLPALGAAPLEQILAVARDPDRSEEADRLFAAAISEAPSTLVRQNYAVFLFQRGRLEAATAQLELVLEADADAKHAVRMLADIYKRQKNSKGGAKLQRRLLRSGYTGLCDDRDYAAWSRGSLKQGKMVSNKLVESINECAAIADERGHSVEAEALIEKLMHVSEPTTKSFEIWKTLDVIQSRLHEDNPSQERLHRYAQTRSRLRELISATLAAPNAWHKMLMARTGSTGHPLPSEAYQGMPAALSKYKACPSVRAEALGVNGFARLVEDNQASVIADVGSWPVKKMWSADNLHKLLGETIVDVDLLHFGGHINRLVKRSSPWDEALQGRRDLTEYVHIRPTRTHMFASDALALMHEPRLFPHVQPYMHQQDVDVAYPGLSNETLGVPDFAASISKLLTWRNLWLGGKTITPLHFDGKDNLLVVLNGTKYVLLLPPKAYHALQISQITDIFPSDIKTTEEAHAFAAGSVPMESPSRKRNSISLTNNRPAVNHTHPESGAVSAEFQAWAQKHGCVATLRKGSALFIPIFWNHAVHGQADAKQGADSDGSDNLVVSLNYWFKTDLQLEDAIALDELRATRRKQSSQTAHRKNEF